MFTPVSTLTTTHYTVVFILPHNNKTRAHKAYLSSTISDKMMYNIFLLKHDRFSIFHQLYFGTSRSSIDPLQPLGSRSISDIIFICASTSCDLYMVQDYQYSSTHHSQTYCTHIRKLLSPQLRLGRLVVIIHHQR